MKTLAIILISFVFSASSYASDQKILSETLPKMVGKSTHEIEKNFPDASSRLNKYSQGVGHPTLRHVWHFKDANKQDRYIVFFGHRLIIIPGNSSASIVLFSKTGKQLGSWHFSTGWRMNLRSAKFNPGKKPFAPTILITSTSMRSVEYARKQYFSFSGDQLHFVRLTDQKDQLVQNHYLSPNFTFGVEASGRSKKEWIEDLLSDSDVRRLAALTYISGIHMDPNQPRERVYSESIDDAKIARALNHDDQVKAAIAKYQKSKFDWLREAATFAAKHLEKVSSLKKE